MNYYYKNEMECWGVTRLTNPKTIQRWKDNGEFQKAIDEGYIFNKGCGRFRTEKCECSKCRKLKEQKAVKE